jgi:hypothetical protein
MAFFEMVLYLLALILRYRKFNAVVGVYCNTPLRANVKNVTECLKCNV